jgi:hypothetical protein
MHWYDVDLYHGSFFDKEPKKGRGRSALRESPKIAVLRQNARDIAWPENSVRQAIELGNDVLTGDLESGCQANRSHTQRQLLYIYQKLSLGVAGDACLTWYIYQVRHMIVNIKSLISSVT